MVPVLVLIWKWLEVGCSSCHVSVFNGKTKFNNRRLDYDNSLGLEAKGEIYIEPVLWLLIILSNVARNCHKIVTVPKTYF